MARWRFALPLALLFFWTHQSSGQKERPWRAPSAVDQPSRSPAAPKWFETVSERGGLLRSKEPSANIEKGRKDTSETRASASAPSEINAGGIAGVEFQSHETSRTAARPAACSERRATEPVTPSGSILGTSISGDQAVDNSAPLNDLILAQVYAMPTGGGYSTNAEAISGLRKAAKIDSTGHLLLRPEAAQPTFCSGATYLVFLSVLDRLNREGRLPLSKEVFVKLAVRPLADGSGVWGRWNANGPGTARLFHELQLGRNFSSFEEARPGDFLKIWWSEEIGSAERGHSVIYLGSGMQSGEAVITFWSANVPGGYGTKTVPKATIKRALFSRLDDVRAIAGVVRLPQSDKYLADMLKRSSSEAEMFDKTGVENLLTGRAER